MDQLKLSPANSCPLTPLNFLERTATIYGNCTSVVYNGMAYTWSETHQRCLRLASSIVSLGVERGQVVSVMAPNIPAMYEMNFAVPMAGAVLNSINLRLDARTVSIMLRHCESKLIFVDCLSKDLLMEALSMFPAESPRPAVVLITDDEFPTEQGGEFVDTYEGLIEKGDPGFNWIRPRSELDPIVLNYTSGTTSAPKGVVHSHRGAFLMTLDSLNQWPMPSQPVYLWTLAMFHANGWSYTWGMAAVGAANICLRKFDAAVIYAAIKNHHVTHMCGAPVVLNMLSNFPGVKPLSQPVYIMTAGAPPPAAVLFRAESLGFVVSHGYGLTETGGLVVSCTWKNKWNKFPAEERAKLKARQGVRTIAMTEVDVVDPETGRSVKRDGATLGEVVFKGGCIMLGYLKDPEGTAKCLKPDGWFYTGDVGVMHADGYLEIKDRSKDVIISGGENLSSVEVESVLYMHPAVNEAAVVARPDEFWGETPCAFLSLKAGVTKKPTEKEIMEFCRARMPHFMVPKTVVFQDDLPKTSTGKIQKFLLRETAKAMGSSKLQRKSRM
nr:probable acyl-activating enzyme 6 [Ipomoea batatas]